MAEILQKFFAWLEGVDWAALAEKIDLAKFGEQMKTYAALIDWKALLTAFSNFFKTFGTLMQ